jgi:hypothetical protein
VQPTLVCHHQHVGHGMVALLFALMWSRVDIPKRFSLARLPSAAVPLDHPHQTPSLSVAGTDTSPTLTPTPLRWPPSFASTHLPAHVRLHPPSTTTGTTTAGLSSSSPLPRERLHHLPLWVTRNHLLVPSQASPASRHSRPSLRRPPSLQVSRRLAHRRRLCHRRRRLCLRRRLQNRPSRASPLVLTRR